jgi:uncharacterized protein YndB with AHSA1/START domain
MTALLGFQIAVSGDRDIIMSRGFDAPPALVFDAFTRPELVRRWLLGPDGWTMPVCEIDLRAGGGYRYVWHQDGRKDFGVSGEFREIVRPRRIVHTERFEPDWHGGEALVTTIFEAAGAGTVARMTIRYATPEARDMALQSGMEKGVTRSYERLDGLLPASMPGQPGYTIVDVPRQFTAVVKVEVAFADLPSAQRAARAKIAAVLPRLGLAGPSVTLSRAPKGGRIYMEPGVIVDRAFTPMDGVEPSELPAGRVVRYLLTGSFEQLPNAWPALMHWCSGQGLQLEGRFWEIYGPLASDPAAQQTTLFALLA